MEHKPDDLFEFMIRPSSGKSGLVTFLERVRRGRDRFVPYFVLSVAAHIAFLGLLAIAGGAGGSSPNAAPVDTSRKAVRRAVESLKLDPQESQALSQALAGLDEDAYNALFDRAPALDPRLGEREQAEIFRSLMRESLGRLKERRSGLSALDLPPWGLLPGSDTSDPVRTAEGDILYPLGADPDGRPTLYRVPAAAAQRLESLRSTAEKERPPRKSLGGKIEIRTDAGFARVPDEDYFRECPYELMIGLGGSVFYAVSGFPRLEAFSELESSGETADGERKRRRSGPDPGLADPFTVIYLPSATVHEGPAAKEALPDLPVLSEENIPKILDGLMELDDDEQVRVFMERFLVGRDPDDPVLARLTQRFLYENLGGAFNLGDRLSTAFDFLEELFYDKTSQGALIAYGLENRASRTGIEILFYLAALYDFERRGLAYLADSLDAIEDVLAGRPGGRADVFNRQAKAFVLGEVYRDFVAGIRRRGLGDIDAALRECRDEQERIYRFLIGKGGEAENRARYALGGLHWDEGEEARALKEWQAIDLSYETPILAQLRWIMSLTYGQDLLWSRITTVFRGESTKSSRAALERYAKYHLWEKRSAKLRSFKEKD